MELLLRVHVSPAPTASAGGAAGGQRRPGGQQQQGEDLAAAALAGRAVDALAEAIGAC